MILDICIIVLVVISVFIGYKKGFVKLVAKLVGFFVAILLAYLLSPSLGRYIYENVGLGNNIKQGVVGTIEKYISSEESLQNSNKKLNESKNNKVEVDIFDKYIKQVINEERITAEIENKKDYVIDEVSEKVAKVVAKGLAFIAIFTIVMICIFILSLILDSVFSLPLLKTFNKTGGIIVSILILVLRIYILFATINLISPLGISFIAKAIKYINTTAIAKFLYNNNLLAVIITKVI